MIADKIKEQREEFSEDFGYFTVPALLVYPGANATPHDEFSYEEILNWHTNSIKQILQALIERIEKQERFDLDDDGGCGDPDCCGERSYYIGHVEDGEYIKAKDTIDYLKSEMACVE